MRRTYQIYFILSILCFSNCSAQKSKQLQPEFENLILKSDLPKIVLLKDKVYKLENPYFTHSVGGAKIKERTIIEFSYDDEYLILNFECLDNPYVDQTSYPEDN